MAKGRRINVAPEKYHSLLFWYRVLLDRRRWAGRPLSPAIAQPLAQRAHRVYGIWTVQSRYQPDQALQREAESVYNDVTWIYDHRSNWWCNMPIKHRLQRTLPPSAAELTRKLIDEWRTPKAKGQPLIVIEGQKGQPTYIYVIWDKWGGMDQLDRSEIIMDAVENLSGDKMIPDMSLITVAMGLTTEEAKRMRIKVS